MSHPRHRSALDRAALVVSAFCLIDCTVIPLVAALAPVTGIAGLDHDVVHDVLAWVVVPLVSFALALGYLRHRNGGTLLAGVFGLTLVVGGYHVEQPVAPIAGAVLLVAVQRRGHASDGSCCPPAPITLVLDRRPRS